MKRLAYLLLVTLALTGCGSRQSTAVASAIPTQIFDPFGVETYIHLRQGSALVPFKNGDAIQSNDLIVEIYLDPYPPRMRTNMDVRVVDARTGKSIDDAEVSAILSMVAMEHGTLITPGEPAGGGHYLVRMNFVMVDEWFVDIRVRTKDKGTQFMLVLFVGL